jgi:hypothetical protein
MRGKGVSKSTPYLYVCLMCVVHVHILDDAHVGAEDGLRMLTTGWLYRELHPGGRRAGDRGLSEATWMSIMGHNSKMPAPLHKKIISSEPGGIGGE